MSTTERIHAIESHVTQIVDSPESASDALEWAQVLKAVHDRLMDEVKTHARRRGAIPTSEPGLYWGFQPTTAHKYPPPSQMAAICTGLGIDPFEVLKVDGAKAKRYPDLDAYAEISERKTFGMIEVQVDADGEDIPM